MGGRSTERGPKFRFVFALFCGVPSLFGLLLECFPLFSLSSGVFSAMFWLSSGVFPALSSHFLECSPLVLPSVGVSSWRQKNTDNPQCQILSLGSSCEKPAADGSSGEPRRPIGRWFFAMWSQRQNLALGVVRIATMAPREDPKRQNKRRTLQIMARKSRKHSRRRREKAGNTPEESQNTAENSLEEGLKNRETVQKKVKQRGNTT